MIDQKGVVDFLSSNNYDLRKSGNGRWIDQKCAADVVTVIADCVLQYGLIDETNSFTSRDVWHAEYTVENVQAIFRKPGVEEAKARNEYDKFFQQPMEMFANAGIMSKTKRGRENFYSILDFDLLEFIALRERNALFFLTRYIDKVLADSGLQPDFDYFFAVQDEDSYNKVKESFRTFIISNTPINGATECNRIFIKVVNPLAYEKQAKGTERGRISRHPITYDMLMYNRNNFRDEFANKPKGITRKEYAEVHPAEINEAYFRYQSGKAKRLLREYNKKVRGGHTEYFGQGDIDGAATHMHHIFPESEFPDISYYAENLIALTPSQHLNIAHPNGKTYVIDKDIQRDLITAKIAAIQDSILRDPEGTLYNFHNLVFVLSVGFEDDSFLSIEPLDFESVADRMQLYYQVVNL